MADAIITKAELARELDLSRARISQLCKIGLPVRPDGKVNRAEAVEWVKACIGALLTLEEPTAPMLGEVAAGFYEPPELPGRFPCIQILTVAELLDGKKLEYPLYRVETFQKAERKTKDQQQGLF